MAEIDQTIEELEQEVLAELEEANGANGKTDAPTEGSVPAEKMEKGKATIVHTEKINVDTYEDTVINSNPSVFLNNLDANYLSITTCELFKLPINSDSYSSTNSENTINKSKQKIGYFFTMIIHLTLVIILFVILKILRILKFFGFIFVEAPKSFGFVFILAWIVSLIYVEDLDLIRIGGFSDQEVIKIFYYIYGFLGWGPFLVWAGFEGHQVQAQKREEYLRSPEGQLELAKNKRDELYKILTDISGISDKVARTILDQYPSFDKLNRASIEKISEIPSIGKNLATAIKARLNNLSN